MASPERSPLAEVLAQWARDPSIAPHVAAQRVLPPRAAQTAPLPPELHPALRDALHRQGIRALYRHQALAWEAARRGAHLMLTTPTASGKSLAYHLPVLHTLLTDPTARALYLFPTKALAHDQENALRRLWPGPPQALGAYDGDTPTHQRPAVRQGARLLLSNPDMLHAGILPRHPQWEAFFAHLRFVVLDEAHIYRGVFGSHVANVLRRLRRVARFYGAQPQFLLASATIANPAPLAQRLLEAPVTLIAENGAPQGERHIWLYNPPLVNPDLGLRANPHAEAVRLAADLHRHGVQTILFERSRRGVEFTLTALRQRLGADPTVRGYRSGYRPAERRAIEAGLRAGEVRTVVTTNALELGIDIGGLDAALLVGYPGTIAATRQQMGRAGRTLRPALAVLVASPDPIDQYLCQHPETLLDRPPEAALLNPDNPAILLEHLRCAAYEIPFQPHEGFGALPPAAVEPLLQALTEAGELSAYGERRFWAGAGSPAQHISLRTTTARRVVLQVRTSTGEEIPLGEVDEPSALWMVHPQAIYLHQGETYRVLDLDLENHRALLEPAPPEYFTEPLKETQIELVAEQGRRQTTLGEVAHGEVLLTTQVVGYRKIHWATRTVLGQEPLDLPPQQMLTTAYWLTLHPQAVETLRRQGVWRNDPNDYGPEWPRLREQIRARDGYRCRICGAPEGQRAHEVHHIVPFRLFADPREANRPENLITLCPTCHRRAETAVRVRSGLAGLAYLLHHLAPLFVMSDRTDLGAVVDARSPLGRGQPTVILHETTPGGVGLAAHLYEVHEALIRAAQERIQTCPCQDGCPSCTGPGGPHGQGSKAETLALLPLFDVKRKPMDLHERLKALGVTLGAQHLRARARPSSGPDPRLLGAEEVATPLGPAWVIRQTYPQGHPHGAARLAPPAAPPALLARWAGHPDLTQVPPTGWYFLDTRPAACWAGPGPMSSWWGWASSGRAPSRWSRSSSGIRAKKRPCWRTWKRCWPTHKPWSPTTARPSTFPCCAPAFG